MDNDFQVLEIAPKIFIWGTRISLIQRILFWLKAGHVPGVYFIPNTCD